MKKRLVTILIAIALAAATTTRTHAQPGISVQFEGTEGGGNTPGVLTAAQIAGVSPLENWNVDDNASGGTQANLTDSTGTPTAASMTVEYYNNQYASGDSQTTPDGIMMSGGFWSGSGYTVVATGIPYPKYNVYVYMLNDDNPNRRYGLTLGSTTYWGAVFDGNGDVIPPYIQDTQTTELAEGTQMQANYVEFTGVTGASITLTGQTPDGNVAMMGIQIIDTAAGPAVATMPVISPTNSSIYAGTPVTLTEVASGQAPLNYQWRTDGGGGGSLTNIAGAVATNLSVSTAGLTVGTYLYDVVVSNSLGVATSGVAALNLIAASAPVLVSQITPSVAVGDVGGQQTFSVAFNGTLPIAYQWQADTGHGFTNIPNATNPSLTLTGLQLADSGEYEVLASNSVGGPMSSSLAKLTVVNGSPFDSAVLAANPVGYWKLNETGNTSGGTLVAADAAHHFNGIYGSGSADGVPGPSPSIGFPGLAISNTGAEFTYGVANSFVTLPELNLNTNTVTLSAWIYPIGTPADACGLVFCRPGADASGFDISTGGQLGYTWNQNDSDTWSWSSGLVPPLQQWSFVALVTSPANAIIYLCNTNGVQSATNPVPSTAEAFNTTALIGDDAYDGGNGTRAFNGVMDEVAIFNYALTSPQILELYFSAYGGAPQVPAPTASPSSTVFAGVTVTLSATVFGLPPFQYQWQSNGVNLAGATDATLVFTNAQVANSGSYDVVVGNSSGTNESPVLVLTVNPPSGPIFVQEPAPASISNYVNGLASFTAVVDGSPPIALQWEFNGTDMAGQTAASLTLPNLQTSESGTYTLLASNALGTNLSTPVTLTVLPPPNPSALNVLTYHNDNTRQGANTNEVLLTLANVNVSTFGRLITYSVDGYIYTQPLYVANLAIPGRGTHNAVFVATEHNSVYAFDADGNGGTNGGLLWQTNLGSSALSDNHEFGDRYNGGQYTDIVPEVGITGTPVIDLASETLYVDVRTRVVGATVNYYHSIHALNIVNGDEQSYSPVVVTHSIRGTGVDSSKGVVTFNPLQENQRPGLTLAGGTLYVAYGSFADTDPYHGWILGFNATNLQQLTNYVFNTTPNATVAAFGANAGEGALWMGGNGLSVDVNTNLYFETANGSFSANTNGGDYSDSFVRLSTTNGLTVGDYFTPYNQASLQAADEDLGSGGPLLLPDSVGSAAHPHLIVGAGKEGTIHLVDRDNMGHYNPANDNQIVEEVPGAIGPAFSSPAYFNNQIYYQGEGDVTKGFTIANGFIAPTPASEATTSFSALGGTPSVSANGTNNGIVWTIQSDAFASSGPDVLHAYNATNLALELYNSSQNLARDNPGGAIQMTTPTVVNGKVYVGAEYALSVFGNSVFLAAPSISPNGGPYTNSVTVTLSEASPGASIYYTLDGTTPTISSFLYTEPFALTSSAEVQAVAIESGATPSAVAQASFVNSGSLGDGTGLTGSYYANHTAANPFTGTPTLVRTDATVDFTWNDSGPAPSVGQSNYTVRWTGSVQPQFSEDYTFYATADDGVRLWINGQEIINGWVDQAPTTYQASLPLVAQQIYNVEMDYYYQNDGAAEAELAWSSPSTPQAIIPQSQLYPYTNPAPTVVLTNPTGGSTFTAAATVSLTAVADAPYNPLSYVSFYTNGSLLGSVSNVPYALTVTGLAAGNYTLTATATDGSGLTGTSAPVSFAVTAASGLPYGLTNLSVASAFYNMPATYTGGPLPGLLSETGVFSNTPAMLPTNGLIPYTPNTPLWSDSALKIRYVSVPNNGGLDTPDQQIGFFPTGGWTFPSGTVFVKTFELLTNLSDPDSIRRLETRLLVRDTNGAVYGVTYKWLPDNSDAVLLSNSLTEAIQITNAGSSFIQNWYYPSPADCLTCHTKVESYVLGVNTRQLNGADTYPATGVTDNQLRTFNRLGLFYPAFNEADITNFEQLSSVTNQNAPLVQRARSYLDANCAQCHQPGGTGITFDARYDTPLTNQNIINAVAAFSLGYDNAKIVAPSDIWRSVLYDRMNTVNSAIKMPTLDRNTIDTNAVQVMAAWINSLGGTPALAPPVLAPASGIFTNLVTLTLLPPDTDAALYYTLDGTLPTTNSILYSGPFNLTYSAVVTANAFQANYVNSVAVSGVFTIVPPLYSFLAPSFLDDGSFQMEYWAPAGQTYILQTSIDLVNWTPLSTNVPTTAPFTLVDPGAADAPYRFYRVVTP
jgi:mono/diheme cytochrome c family protein